MASEMQPSLFDLAPTVQPDYAKGSSIQERFAEFDRRNPHVFEALKRLSLDMKRRGFSKWSIKAAFEICRWMASFQTSDAEFKLNNDFHASYSRKLMAEVPELDGFFETRQTQTASSLEN